jgi:SAM-dependent methyltransferase
VKAQAGRGCWQVRLFGLEIKRTRKRWLGPSHFYRELRNLDPGDAYRHLQFAGLGLKHLIDEYAFETVLDIGSGQGLHTEVFLRSGKDVTSLDLGSSIYYERSTNKHRTIHADFNSHPFPERFDCIWASHVLEHQLNVNAFLRKCHETLNDRGILAVTVPPMKPEIVGGHVTLWNAGLLLYNLVLAGYDCRNARVLKYGYNITAIVQKNGTIVLPQLSFDSGDIDRLAAYLPEGFHEGIDGDFAQVPSSPGLGR